MSTLLITAITIGFFSLLALTSYFSSRNAGSETFYTGNRRSSWYLVAFAMIGSTISGVTFISVPGEVGNTAWTYLQFLLGNFLGYWIIALVLLPLYYRLNLISIYTYLDKRFGFRSYKTGAFFFLLSQVIGASFRLYLAAVVLQIAFFDAMGIPFFITVFLTLLTIWLYTYRAGIKTVVWTDSLQTIFILGAVVLTILVIARHMDLSAGEMIATIKEHPYSNIFDWNWQSKTNFFKQFAAGVGIAIVMNGLDQNMMQKNLTCKTRREAQKNMFWFSFAFIIANVFFLSLGVMLYAYSQHAGITIPQRSDDLFPMLAVNNFGILAGALFLVGILSAAYSSADSALTALTTSFCIDILNVKIDTAESKRTRLYVHIAFALIMFIIIVLFRLINDRSVVSAVFTVAGYTYGPLLGLFTFGIFMRKAVKDKFVPIICILSPVLTWIITSNSKVWFGGYEFGFERLLLNGLITFIGLLIVMKKDKI